MAKTIGLDKTTFAVRGGEGILTENITLIH